MNEAKFIYKEFLYNGQPIFLVVPFRGDDSSIVKEGDMNVRSKQDGGDSGGNGKGNGGAEHVGGILTGTGAVLSGGADLVAAIGGAVNPQANVPDTVVYSNSTSNSNTTVERQNDNRKLLGGLLIGSGVLCMVIIFIILLQGRQQPRTIVVSPSLN